MKLKTKDLVLMAMMAAVTAVCSWITIPTPAVPFTLSILAVFLTGGLLRPLAAFLSMVVYFLVGLVGLPVFAGFQAGIAPFAGPTAGYLIAYPIMALVVSLCMTKLPACLPLVLRAVTGMLLALVICYVGGTTWLATARNMSFMVALSAGVVPFIVFDLLKIVAAAALTAALEKPLCALDRR